MSIDRYSNDNIITNGADVRLLSTNQVVTAIRSAIRTSSLPVVERVLTSNTRLDIIAHEQYGDGRLWWVIAAASNIGWWLQAPAGTRILIPVDLEFVRDLL